MTRLASEVSALRNAGPSDGVGFKMRHIGSCACDGLGSRVPFQADFRPIQRRFIKSAALIFYKS
jgi:hypothetical protein